MRTATVSHTIKVILVIARPQTESRSDGIQLGSSKSPGPMSIPPSARKAGWSPTLPPFTSLTEPLHDHVQRRAGTEHQADQEPDVLRYAEPPVDQRADPGAPPVPLGVIEHPGRPAHPGVALFDDRITYANEETGWAPAEV